MKLPFLSKVTDLFNFKARAAEKHEAQRREELRQENFERLQRWFKETRKSLTADLEHVSFKPPYTKHSYAIDVDTSTLTAEDIDKLELSILGIHSICSVFDVDLQIGGFSRLPSDGVVTHGGWTKGPAVVVSVDTGRTYNMYAHPNAYKLKESGHPMHGSRPRPRAKGNNCSFN